MRGLCCLTLLGSLVLAAPAAAAEPSDAETTAADAYDAAVDQAAQQAAEGNWSEAVAKFREAAALRRGSTSLFNLAQAERNAGQLVEALGHFREASQLAKTEGAADVGRLSDAAIVELEGRVARIELQLPPATKDAVVSIDGRGVPVDEVVVVLPGKHRLVVSAGPRAFVRELSARPGQHLKVPVRFESKQRPPPAQPSTAPATAPPARAASGPPAGAIVLGGVGMAALVGSAVFHVRRNERLEDAGKGCERSDGAWTCPSSLENDRAHRDAIESARAAEAARDALLGVGVASVVAGGLWWALSGSEEAPREPPPVELSPSSRGASARMRFVF